MFFQIWRPELGYSGFPLFLMTAGRQFLFLWSFSDHNPPQTDSSIPVRSARNGCSGGAHEYFCTPRANTSAVAPKNCKRL
jgi:hypothetical protein